MGTYRPDIRRRVRVRLMIAGLAAVAGTILALGVQARADQADSWQAAVLKAQVQAASLDPGREAFTAAAEEFSVRAEREFPIEWDWCLQDAGPDFGRWLSVATASATARKAADKAIAELGADGNDLRRDFDRLVHQSTPAESGRWLALYLRAAGLRREIRLRALHQRYPQWVFTKHCILGGSHYAYTEGQSDAQHERQFEPGAALCRLEIEGGRCTVRTLLDDPNGVIRDPDVSWDGRHVLFAWKKSDRRDDYHLYEMELATGSIRQLTGGLGFADYEGVYLPNDDIVFNSTRCVQTVDCWWTEVSNLYTCDRDGRYLRRLAFDQVHDNFPTVMPDGRVIYTRWEYSDRGQLFVQGLFQMNPDGTGQTEFYGNNSWFPTSLLHARGIPGTQKVVATFSGHHTLQVGKLGIVDPARGRQENSGAQLIAPVRETPADRIDYYGQDGELFQYPYPLGESEFVVACAPLGWSRSPTRFKLYWIAADGRRELLVADPEISCNQAVPLAARPRPLVRPSLVDYSKTTGTCYLQDIYAGPGLEGVARGTIKRLRVVALDYRAAGMGWNYNAGPAGDALVCTPPAMSVGVRETAEAAVRAGLHHIQFVVRPEADAAAIDTYLKSLEPLPDPRAEDQDLIARAQRGKLVFEKAGCRECHPAPLYTSLASYDVGTGIGCRAGQAFDTPTLVELWRTAPYLHDGRATTLEEVLTTFNPEDRHGKTSNLTETEIDDLTAFLLSL